MNLSGIDTLEIVPVEGTTYLTILKHHRESKKASTNKDTWWCGYVFIPSSHEMAGKNCSDINEIVDVEISYSRAFEEYWCYGVFHYVRSIAEDEIRRLDDIISGNASKSEIGERPWL